MTMAPLIVPLAPNAGENVTLIVQAAAARRVRLGVHGFVAPPVAEKSPLVAMLVSVTELALVFLMVTVLAALLVLTACAAKDSVAGAKVSGAVPPPAPVPESPMS